VDDDTTLLELLCEAFKIYGLRVFTAENGIDGWHLFNRERIDIVLTDLDMPGINGAELSNRIRGISPGTIISVITGGDPETGDELLESGTADFFFEKPFALSYVCKTLLSMVQTVRLTN
jgi:DNA-binding response OmpR family regulator